jgi:coenzyme F420-reducing hydrogenase beta subunit
MEAGAVDAVALVAADPNDSLQPLPILARTSEDLLRGRGVKPSLAPSLAVLDDVKADPTIKRLLFCGVGCSVQALRAVQADLGLDELYVLGTHCVDNSPSIDATKTFLNAAGVDTQAAEAAGDGLAYEFMADFKVHVKRSASPPFSSSASFSANAKVSDEQQSDTYEKIPYFCLPGAVAEVAIAPSCLTCFDYTNGLADLVVGYMGAPLEEGNEMTSQWQQVHHLARAVIGFILLCTLQSTPPFLLSSK